MQQIAVEKTRLGIPILFEQDVIHGYKTIFPIPLGEACSWDLDMMRKTAGIAALEAASDGLNWTFAPMVDIARDARWGRVMEGAGEDPYLGSLIAKARVEGFQGRRQLAILARNAYAAGVRETFCRLWSRRIGTRLQHGRAVRTYLAKCLSSAL